MTWRIPLFDLNFDDAEEQAALAVIRSRWLTQGEKTAEFERAFAERHGARFGIAASSCTAGLHLVAHALGIGPGDEVIVPSLSFVATASTIVQTGAAPVFADVESPDRPLLDPEDVARKITPRTKAVVCMHYAGCPCDMDRLVEVAERHRLSLIEDCAHAPLAEWRGRKTGTFGRAGVFSFFSNKNLSAGEGGLITTDDEALAQRLRLLRSHAMTHQTLDRHKGHAFDYDVVALGFNYRFDEIRAALALAQLAKLESATQRRAALAACYREQLATIDWIRVPFSDPFPGRSAHHIFPILLEPGAPARDDLMRSLRESGIQTSIHYRPIHSFSFYRERFPTPDSSLPVTTNLAPRLLTLPLYPALDETQIRCICEQLRAGD
jgi:dTDP-4-amino-4,6-dideoxygalactose transaminase